MIDPALEIETETEEYIQPRVAQAVGLAERDQRSLIAIVEGEIGKNIDYYRIENVEPQGLGLYTFDPSSQSLKKISYKDLKAATNIEIDNPEENVANLRKLLYQGPNLDIVINSIGGHMDVEDVFSRVIQQTTYFGGEISSYVTAKAWSLAAGLFVKAKTRYVLPFSVTAWHTPSFGKEDSKKFRETIEEAERELREKEFTPLQKKLIQQRLKEAQERYDNTVAQFRSVIAYAPENIRQGLMEKLISGEKAFIFGPQFVEWGLAEQYENVESMKRSLYRSIGVQPYAIGLEPLEKFFDESTKEYEEIMQRLIHSPNKEKIIVSMPKEERSVPRPVQEQTRISYRANAPSPRLRQISQSLPFAAAITALAGISYLGFSETRRQANIDTEMQPVIEEFCPDSYQVSLQTGPKIFSYDFKGELEEIIIERDILGQKHVRVPSIAYSKICP